MSRLESPKVAQKSDKPDPVKGASYMMASAMSISGANGMVVHVASTGLHAFEIAFFRQLIGALMMTALTVREGLRHFYTRRIKLHILRSILNAFALLAYFYGLSLEPLSKVVALSLTAPLFATLGAVLLLKEGMTRHRWIALGLGVTGALIILRPGIQAVSLGAILILLSNASWACALLVIKKLTETDSAITIALWAVYFQVPVALGAAIFVWQGPTLSQFWWLAGIGLLGTAAQIFLGDAFRRADATVVLPIDFTKIFYASLIGYFFFDQVPEIWIWIGAFVVFGAVFYNAWQERAVRRKLQQPPTR